jgi:N-acetylglutamate synthase-like GNAT family acetyltransferase
MIELVMESMEQPQSLVSGLEATLLRIGKAALDDHYALELFKRYLFSLCTSAATRVEHRVAHLKRVELRVLVGLAGEARIRNPAELPNILSFVIAWTIQNEYENEQDAHDVTDWGAALLAANPQDIVSKALDRSWRRFEGKFDILELPETQFVISDYNYDPRIRYYTISRLSELTIRVVRLWYANNPIRKLTSLRISPVDSIDIEEFLQMQKSSYEDKAVAYNDYLFTALTEDQDELEKEIHSKLILKAVANNRIVGSIRAYVVDSTCRIEKLWVVPDVRNHGIGEELVTNVERQFRKPKLLEVAVADKCSVTLGFFKHLGFRTHHVEHLNDKLTIDFLRKQNGAMTKGKRRVRNSKR